MMRGEPLHTPEAIVEANGIAICYETFGNPADPALVLIMGVGAQMISWEDEFCEQLAGRGFRVIRFDNRDAGKSTRFDRAGIPDVAAAMTRAWMGSPVAAPYLLRDMALDVIGLLDALRIDRAHLVGASMGGTIAQVAAIEHPQRVLSLTSIMSTTGDRNLPHAEPWALAALFKPAPLDLAGYIDHYVNMLKVLRVGAFPEEEERDRIRGMHNHARGLNPGGSARQLTAILASGSRREALRNVKAPTLVIHGDLDPLVPLAAGVDTANCIPGAELVVIEGMGHGLPKRLWPRIIDAVARRAA